MPPTESSPLILCIDDHESGLHIRRMLLERSGYRVITALTATEGLRELQESNGVVSLVITDYFLPDMTGDSLAERIKALRPELPVLMLTGSVQESKGKPWIDRFLQKGGPTEELLKEIESLIPRAA